MDWKALRRWALERAKERSTWLSLITGASTLCGCVIAPEKVEVIASLGATISTMIGVVTREQKDPE